MVLGGEAGQCEELLTRGRTVPQQSVQRGGDRPRTGGTRTPLGHAQVLGLDDDADSPRRQLFLQPVGNLLGQPFLHLQITGEHFHGPGQLRQPEDALPRQVPDVGEPVEGLPGAAPG